MEFLRKLFANEAHPASTGYYTFTVRCDRCGETIEGKVNLMDDLSMDDAGGYHVRKVLIGNGRCFQQIEVRLTFDPARQLSNRQIAGGTFVETD